MLLTACGPAQGQAQADQNKAKLDRELARAKDNLGIPDSML